MVLFADGLAADFGSAGLQVYDGSSWQTIGTNPDNTGNTMVAYNGGLAVNYSSGLWFWKNGTWAKLREEIAEYLTVFEGKLAADLGSAGLQVYDGSSWQKIGSSPDNTGNTMIAID